MTAQSPDHVARSFTLTELIVLMPFFAILCFLGLSALRLEMTTNARVAEQADRNAVMNSTLRILRRDLARASAIAAGSFSPVPPSKLSPEDKEEMHRTQDDVSQSLRVEYVPMEFHLGLPRGRITWRVRENAPLYEHPANSTLPADPPTQVLVRVNTEGVIEEWRLHGLRITFEPDFEGRRRLRVRFDSKSRYDTGNRIHRVYETTLRVGGQR